MTDKTHFKDGRSSRGKGGTVLFVVGVIGAFFIMLFGLVGSLDLFK